MPRKWWWGGGNDVAELQPTCLEIRVKSPAKPSRNHGEGSGNGLLTFVSYK